MSPNLNACILPTMNSELPAEATTSPAGWPRTNCGGASAGRAWIAVAVAQVGVLVGLAWFWWSADSDPSATTVDWGFVVLSLATPTALAGSFLVGFLVKGRTSAPSTRIGQVFAKAAHVTTLVFLVSTLLIAPALVVGSIVFEPIG